MIEYLSKFEKQMEEKGIKLTTVEQYTEWLEKELEALRKLFKWVCSDCAAEPCYLKAGDEGDEPTDCPFKNGKDCKWELLKEGK